MSERQCVVECHASILGKFLNLPEGVEILAVDMPIDRHGVIRLKVRGMGGVLVQGCALQSVTGIAISRKDAEGVSSFTVDWSRVPR